VQERLYLKIRGERFFGRVGDFQNELTAIVTSQAKVLIALAHQGIEPGLEAILFLQQLQDFALRELRGLCFDYRERVCLGHSLPSGNGKGRSMVCRLHGIKGPGRLV
jgi:hypothetical protein